MTGGGALGTLALLASLLCAWAPPQGGGGAQSRPDEEPRSASARPFRCTERLRLPLISNIFEAKWSPDSTTLAVSWFAKIPSVRSVAGYRENDTIIDTLDVRSGALRPLGVGERPEWSASGRYVSYWGGTSADELRVSEEGRVLARLLATIPDARWVGETLYFIEKDEIRTWSEGTVRTVARLEKEFVPRYPRDDVYFSADGGRFTLTRYSLDGTTKRFIGVADTGAIEPFDDGGATYIAWAPTGGTLLLRYPDRIELRAPDGETRSVTLAASGQVQDWTPDGRGLLLGRVSPTVPGGDVFDTFAVWGAPAPADTATLPNLVGARSFSPNGEYFTGVSRIALDSTQLEVYRCNTARSDADTARRDAETIARRERIAADTHRFVRPAAGPISQFLQGSHTGIDVAAPFGSLVVASDDGVVNAVGWIAVGGRRVCVQHSAGLESCYFHTSAALVSVGDRVVRGQPIALIGLTGITTGPHVHWEAKLFGRIVDPLAR